MRRQLDEWRTSHGAAHERRLRAKYEVPQGHAPRLGNEPQRRARHHTS